MSSIEEEAIRAVSTSLSPSDSELFNSIENARKKWRHELDSAKSTARSMLANVLSQQETLRSSLSTAAQLWNVLLPHENGGEKSLEQQRDVSASEVEKENSPQREYFVGNPDQLKMVKALQNVSHTIFLVESIQAAPEMLDKANQSLEKIKKDGLLEVHPGNAALLVEAHEALTAVERLRDTISLDCAQQTEYDSSDVECFTHARSTRKVLEDLVINGVFSNILSVSQSNPRLLVAVARVVVAEQKEDEWWFTYLQRSPNAHRASSVRPYVSQNYKEKAISAVLSSLNKVFTNKEKELGFTSTAPTDPALIENSPNKKSCVFKRSSSRLDVLNLMSWIEDRRQEKETIRRFVTPCVPPSFSIATLYENELHRQLMRLVTKLLHLVHTDGSMALTEDDVLQLTTWYSKYIEDVGDENEPIDSFLDDTDRQRLITALQKNCAGSIDKQIDAVLQLKNKNQMPSSKSNAGSGNNFYNSGSMGLNQGLCRTDLADVILRFIMEHVKHMLSLNVRGLDIAIAETVSKRLGAFQETVRKAIREGSLVLPTDEYGYYLCAIANNMARCLEYSEDLRDLFVPVSNEGSRAVIEGRLEVIIEGFRVSASMGLLALINGMTENLSMHARRFYAPNTGTEVMLDVVATLEDYFSDYEMHLLPFHFEHVVIESLKRIVVWYIVPFLQLSDQRVDDGVARRFTSLPTFDEATAAHGDDLFAEDVELERELSSRRSETDRGSSKRRSRGLSTMNADAVVAQIDKDMSNLGRFVRRKVGAYQKKQVGPALEPMTAIRSLYLCNATADGMAQAYATARSVVARCVRPAWVRDSGVDGQLTARVAEMIWESRGDVNPVVLLEAITIIRTGSSTAPVQEADAHTVASRRGGGPSSEAGIGGAESGNEGTDSLVWAPSPSRLRWRETRGQKPR